MAYNMCHSLQHNMSHLPTDLKKQNQNITERKQFNIYVNEFYIVKINVVIICAIHQHILYIVRMHTWNNPLVVGSAGHKKVGTLAH